ncbi:MAG: hypothetical protein AAB426_13455 [Myxococcota bacterium]
MRKRLLVGGLAAALTLSPTPATAEPAWYGGNMVLMDGLGLLLFSVRPDGDKLDYSKAAVLYGMGAVFVWGVAPMQHGVAERDARVWVSMALRALVPLGAMVGYWQTHRGCDLGPRYCSDLRIGQVGLYSLLGVQAFDDLVLAWREGPLPASFGSRANVPPAVSASMDAPGHDAAMRAAREALARGRDGWNITPWELDTPWTADRRIGVVAVGDVARTHLFVDELSKSSGFPVESLVDASDDYADAGFGGIDRRFAGLVLVRGVVLTDTLDDPCPRRDFVDVLACQVVRRVKVRLEMEVFSRRGPGWVFVRRLHTTEIAHPSTVDADESLSRVAQAARDVAAAVEGADARAVPVTVRDRVTLGAVRECLEMLGPELEGALTASR